MNDPRIVWRYTIEYATPTDESTAVRSGRARAYTEVAVEDWLVSELAKKFGDDFTVIDCKIWPAVVRPGDADAPVIMKDDKTKTNIAISQPSVSKKEEPPEPGVTGYFSVFGVTPGLGLGGKAHHKCRFYEAIKEATSA